MLYFKTKIGRLIIEIFIDETLNIYMLIPSKNDKSFFGNYTYVDENIWKRLHKISTPQNLDENLDDRLAYDCAMKAEEIFQQEMADLDWQMMQAEKEMWRQGASNLIKNGTVPLMVF